MQPAAQAAEIAHCEAAEKLNQLCYNYVFGYGIVFILDRLQLPAKWLGQDETEQKTMSVKMMDNETVSIEWMGQLDYRSLSDGQLVSLLTERDHQALAVIYDRYAKPVYSLAMKMMSRPERAEDVVQEVFIKLWRKPYSYDAQRGAFINWVLGVTHNQAIDELQRERNHDRTISHTMSNANDDEEQAIDIADPHADPAEEAWYQVRLDIIREAMVKLPVAQREVIEMAYFGGLTQVEIAARLDEPLGTVKTRTRLALQKLKVLLEEEGLRS